jgi:hypothetical protein
MNIKNKVPDSIEKQNDYFSGMPARNLPVYLFRGTTIDYPGNKTSINTVSTPTSWYPVKALWFALECFERNPDTVVVYVAKTEKLAAFNPIYNVLKTVESEIGLSMLPSDFYPCCEGYIHVPDLQNFLMTYNIDAYQRARKDNITRLCAEETPKRVHFKLSRL